MAKKKQIKKKQTPERKLTSGRVYVTATFNNTLVTLTDNSGNTLTWGTSGSSGFKGARKATPFAAISAMEKVAQKAKELGIVSILNRRVDKNSDKTKTKIKLPLIKLSILFIFVSLY